MKELSVTPPKQEVKEDTEPKPIEKVNSTEYTVKEEQKENKDKPYPADYFKIPDWGDVISQPELDIYGLKDKIVFIESYITERLSDRDMKTDRIGIYDALREIEHQLQIDDKYQPHARINKVYQYLFTLKAKSEEELERKRKIEALLKKS